MKKSFSRFSRISALLLALTLCLLFCIGCQGGKVDPQGSVTVVIAPTDETGKFTEYQVNLSELNGQKGLMTVLDYLKETASLTYTAEDSGYGAFLTSIGDLLPEGNQYISLYTSVAADTAVGEWATTVEYKGKTLTASGVGATSMTVESGAILYLCLLTY